MFDMEIAATKEISLKEVESNASEYGWKVLHVSEKLEFIQLLKAGDVLTFTESDQTYVVRRYKDQIPRKTMIAKADDLNFLRDPYKLTKDKANVSGI